VLTTTVEPTVDPRVYGELPVCTCVYVNCVLMRWLQLRVDGRSTAIRLLIIKGH